MLFHYDAETDMLYIQLAARANTESEEVAPGIVLDRNAEERVVGLEIEDASKCVDLTRLEVLTSPFGRVILAEQPLARD